MMHAYPKSKSQQIVDVIVRAIDTGELAPGVRLPPMRRIGEQYGASQSVVDNAFDILERQQRIIRKPRSGVIVNPDFGQEKSLDGAVLLCLASEGHLFGTVFHQVLERCNQQGVLAIAIDHAQLCREEVNPQLQRRVAKLLDEGVQGAVVYGADYWKNPFLQHAGKASTVFVIELDHAVIDGHGVLFDYDAASHALVHHLHRSGRRRIGFSIPKEAFVPGQRLLHFEQMKTGYERALRELGLAAARQYLPELNDLTHPEAMAARLVDLMRSPAAPDAILTYMDYQAVLLRDAAERAGIRVPGDLALTGFFNTPWATHGRQTLTTVAFDLDRLVERTMELLRTQPRDVVIEYLPPNIVQGESSPAP